MTRKRRIKSRRSILVISVLALIILIAIPLFRYNIFIFRRAAREIPRKYKTLVVKWFRFSEENSLREWEEKIFKGKVVYTIEKSQDLSYVRAISDKTASALYYKIKLDAKSRYPMISWKWKVERFPEKKLEERLDTENEDDFAARVYVIFPAAFFTNSKVLEYIWAEKLPVGMSGPSPYSKNIQLLVLRSGPVTAGEWISEERDIVADYMRFFKRGPEYNVGAVAFMTNTDHTKTTADAMYDEIKLEYKEGVSGTKEDVSDAKEDVSDAKEDVSDAKEDVSVIKEDVSDVKGGSPDENKILQKEVPGSQTDAI